MEIDIDVQNFNINRVLGIKKINKLYFYYVKFENKKKPEWINLDLCKIKKNQFFIDLMINQWGVSINKKEDIIDINRFKTESQIKYIKPKNYLDNNLEKKRKFEEIIEYTNKFKNLITKNPRIIDLSGINNEIIIKREEILFKKKYIKNKKKDKKMVIIDLSNFNYEMGQQEYEESIKDNFKN